MSLHCQVPVESQLPLPLLNKLRELSRQDLEEVLGSREKVDGLVTDSEEIQSMQLDREMSLATNRSLAESNLALQPCLESGKSGLLERYGQLRELHQTVTDRRRQMENHLGRLDSQSLLTELEAKAAKVETESEELAERFLSGQCALELFLDGFTERRRAAHACRVRLEKLREILLAAPRSSPSPPRPAPPHRPPPPRPLHPVPAHLPYDPNPGQPGPAPPYPAPGPWEPHPSPFPRGSTPAYPAPGPPSYPAPCPRLPSSYPPSSGPYPAVPPHPHFCSPPRGTPYPVQGHRPPYPYVPSGPPHPVSAYPQPRPY